MTITGHHTQLDGAPRCLNCNTLIDGATSVGSDVRPKPGDVTVCMYCGHVMAFNDELTMRELTGQEIIEIAGNPVLIQVQKATATVRKMMKKDREG